MMEGAGYVQVSMDLLHNRNREEVGNWNAVNVDYDLPAGEPNGEMVRVLASSSLG